MVASQHENGRVGGNGRSDVFFCTVNKRLVAVVGGIRIFVCMLVEINISGIIEILKSIIE